MKKYDLERQCDFHVEELTHLGELIWLLAAVDSDGREQVANGKEHLAMPIRKSQ
ncbi:MAG: hypothetical protein HQL83_17345 [Magnetococcales bacterium]|nr:hypothetical protein [Magnetococcales bacterium]